MIIAIDGPAGSGKSSVAKILAKKLHFTFFDSGAMYRAITYLIINKSIDPNNEKQLAELLDSFTYKITFENGEAAYFANGKDVTKEIRSREVTKYVSDIAALPSVRKALVTIQRRSAKNIDAVFEGRDMGSVVFPEAQIKIFLNASADIRAQRRFQEILQKSPSEAKNLSLEKVKEDIIRRDHFDSTREHSPLTQAEDAKVIDASNLTLDEVVDKIIEYKEKIHKT